MRHMRSLFCNMLFFCNQRGWGDLTDAGDAKKTENQPMMEFLPQKCEDGTFYAIRYKRKQKNLCKEE